MSDSERLRAEAAEEGDCERRDEDGRIAVLLYYYIEAFSKRSVKLIILKEHSSTQCNCV